MIWLLCSTLAFAGRTEKAENLAQQAWQAQEEGDLNTAWKKADKALKLDPNNVTAHYVRGMVLEVMIPQSSSTMAQLMGIMVQADFSFVEEHAPGTMLEIGRAHV